MNMMKGLTAVGVIACVVWVAAGPAQGREAATASWLVEQRVKSLSRKYRVTDAQRAHLARIGAAQARALEDLDRTNSAKGKDLQRRIDPLQAKLLAMKKQTTLLSDQLRTLQDEMFKLEASRKALLRMQAAQLDAVITEQQRVDLAANDLIRRHVRGRGEVIDNGKRAKVTAAAQQAARTILRAEAAARRETEQAALKQLTDALVKIIGPAMTRALREDAVNKTMGPYRRLDLSDEQKAKIFALTEQFAAQQAKRQEKVEALDEQIKALRSEQSSEAPAKLKQTIIETVLTAEQREKFKPKTPKPAR